MADTTARALREALADPVRAALTGRLRAFGSVRGAAVRFTPVVSPFGAVPRAANAQDWADLAELCGPGSEVVCVRAAEGPPQLPAGWQLVRPFPGFQMEGSSLPTAPDGEAVELGPADRTAMTELVARTRPGPWLPRTADLGRFLGLRRGGRLVAMAGERLRLGAAGAGGATEISAVCTDPQWRGRGFAGRLVRAVGHEIVRRGELPVLHAAAVNEDALRLYRDMGFTVTRAMRFDGVRTPD